MTDQELGEAREMFRAQVSTIWHGFNNVPLEAKSVYLLADILFELRRMNEKLSYIESRR